MIFGLIGLVGQAAAFALVTGLIARRRSASFAVLVAGVVAVYGYALVVAFCALIGLPWQVVNLLLLLALLIIAASPVRGAVLAGLAAILPAARRARGALTVVGVVVLLQASIAVVKPELSIDGQLYHGPALVNILQNGTLWGWSAANEYMYYTDLTMAGGVNLATFTGVATFDDALQLPHLLLFIALVNWALGSRLSSPLARTAIGVLLASSTVIWVQPRILYVDLAYGVAVAAVILISVLAPRLAALELAVLGILLGAIFATKPTGILTGILLIVAVVVITLLRRRDDPVRVRVGALALGLLPPLALATSFYVRNLVAFGNPVYPVKATFGPLVLPGIIDLSVFASGDRGTGLVDPGRIVTYAASLGSGVLHGVTKLDYDPRGGGYGFVPLALALIALALLVVQLIPRNRGGVRPVWGAQLTIVALGLVILTIQPATYDTRYVIGPTAVFVVAGFLTAVGRIPHPAQLVVGVVALVLATGQIAWNEKTVYPGVSTVLQLRSLPPGQQATTPGNPWGTADSMSWLPDDECVTIAVQTAGGITAVGMSEGSEFAALPYALYGDRLCNEVDVIQLRDRDADSPENESAVQRADFLVVYRDDIDTWIDAYPRLEECGAVVDEIRGTEMFPKRLSVIATC